MAQSGNTIHYLGKAIISGGSITVGTAAEGVELVHNGTNKLNIDPATANDTIRVGETTQADVQIDGATDLVWDASAGSLVNGSFVGAFVPDAAIETITAGTGGAINVTSALTRVSTDGTDDAFTLANGTAVGQVKSIVLDTHGGGDAVITPANFADGTTLTLGVANEIGVLMWNGTNWRLILTIGGAVA